MASAAPFASLDAPPLAALMQELSLGREKFEALIDPGVSPRDAATSARHIAIGTFDQGCCGPATPHAIRALLDALGHPDCRAPAQVMRVLGAYLFDNAEQDDDGDPDDLFDGFDTRLPRWAPFKGARWPFLRDIHRALATGVPLYLAHLEHSDPDVRQAACYVLAPRYPRRKVLPALHARLALESDPLALAATVLTTALHHRYARRPLLDNLQPLLGHDHAAVQAAAAIALANHGPKVGRESTRAVLTAARDNADLQWSPRAHGVTLAHNNLRQAAARALGRLPEAADPFAELDDNSIIKHDSFLDETVARAAARGVLRKLRKLPDDLSQTKGKTRQRLAALAVRPAAWSRDVGGRLGTPLGLARALGLRPAPALDRLHGNVTLGAWLAEQLVGTGSVAVMLEPLQELTADQALDAADDLLAESWRSAHLVLPWPDQRPREVLVRLRAEQARRDARCLVLAFALARAAANGAEDDLHRRALAATGDRLGIQRVLAVYLLADLHAQPTRPPPQSSSRPLRCVAHLPEFVPQVRAYLAHLPASTRQAVLSGWEPLASCFYADMLDRPGLVKLARYADLVLDPTHSLPWLDGLGATQPQLQHDVVTAMAERQATADRFAHRPGAMKVGVRLADGREVLLWGEPTPQALSERSEVYWP